MRDEKRTEKQLIDELRELRDVVVRLRALETECNDSRDALRREKEWVETYLHIAGVILVVLEADQRVSLINKKGCEILGYTREEIVGKNWFDVFVPGWDRDRVKAGFAKLIAGEIEPIEYFENPVLSKNGEERTIAWRNTVFRNKQGHIMATLSSGEDITERKRAETALRESEERYRQITEAITDYIFTVHIEHGRPVGTLHGPACKAVTGYTSEEFHSDPFLWIRMVHEEDRDVVREQASRILWAHDPQPIEHRIIRKDGNVRWVNNTPVLYYDAHGNLTSYDGLIRDITERRKVEEALKESEARHRTVLEANPDPVVVYDMEGRVIYVNPAFTRVFGWTSEERLGQKMDLAVPEENWPETKMMINKVLLGENFYGFETQRCTKDGDVIPVSISAAIYRDKDGRPVGSVMNLRDLRARKTLEAQLLEAQKMEAIGTLAGGVAHDFNNLLQVVRGFAQLLLDGKDHNDPDYRGLQKILRASERGAELTRQLLTYSRKVESKRRAVDLNLAVREVGGLLERSIPKSIELEQYLADGLRAVFADPVQLEQMLMNLALNANDAMADVGKIVIQTENVTLD
jgi:PAS domain S-box-containing protein